MAVANRWMRCVKQVAGFALLAGVSGMVVALRAQAPQVAITWDDLPAHSALPAGQTRQGIAQAILAAMQAQHLPPVYGFINGVRTEQEPGSDVVLKMWTSAGFPLGNHTWSHMNLNQHTAEEFEADLLRDEPLLEHQPGPASQWHWLRYPFLAEGDTPAKKAAVRAFLAAHGYRIAGVTMSFGDYAWNEPYARCVRKGDEAAIAALEKTYLAAAEADLAYERGVAQKVFGHDIPYVLLMHVGAFDARMLPRLLALYRGHGVQFVTLEQAQAHPFYRGYMDPSLPATAGSLAQAAAEKHIAVGPGPAFPDMSALCQ